MCPAMRLDFNDRASILKAHTRVGGHWRNGSVVNSVHTLLAEDLNFFTRLKEA